MPSVSEVVPKAEPTESQLRDKQFSQILHGPKPTDQAGYLAILKKNPEAQKVASTSYFQFWDDKVPQNETPEHIAERSENYTTLVNSYYNLATDLYEYGWNEKFHFCRFYPGEGFEQALARHEHYLALKLGIQKGDLVLDVGSGIGGPAREMSLFAECNVVGLNNNDYQIDRATVYTAKRGLSEKVRFVKGDFMKMPFPDNTFDRVYSIEATCHAPSLTGVYSEIFRVLKPGGTYATYEWLLDETYDASNPHHRQISYDIEIGDGIPCMVKKSVAVAAFKEVGFGAPIFEEDLADMGDEIPWYYPIAGETKYTNRWADWWKILLMTKRARYLSHGMLGVLGAMGLAPPDARKIANAMGQAADALVAGGRVKLFTPMQLYVVKKPE